MDNEVKTERLVVVSNRLPITLRRHKGRLVLSKASGGLITALQPLLKAQKGVWVGWPGTTDYTEEEIAPLIQKFEMEAGYRLVPIMLTKEEVSGYYDGFSNEIIWPLFHDLHSLCNFNPSYWKQYEAVNEKFARKVMEVSSPRDFLWIQDYHLILLAKKLKNLGFKEKLTFFLHIPFAPLDIFLKIPWRFDLLRAMLSYDFIGFQTMRDQRNFIHSVRTLLGDAAVKGSGNKTVCMTHDTQTQIGTFPISIDFREFTSKADRPEVLSECVKLKNSLSNRKMVFSLDRLDYTKGIPYRLEAIRTFLMKYPEYHGKVNFIQVVVPSRTEIPGYYELKQKIDRLVGEINSEYTTSGWIPIHYMFHPLTELQLVSFYRASDVCLVTPVKDGMNLVSKEFAAANIEEEGVLVLSEFAGSACQLKEACLLVNPYDRERMADAIYQALEMGETERRNRMKRLRKKIRDEDIYHWVESVFQSIGEEPGFSHPVAPEYIPAEVSPLDK
ncbi:alpha,alpha-trehalose-phosphate synthase (UDP-forming) [Estrella lausannensis]|uniref:Uncharacterized protein n=1 Tax=Estrella lausannensis TaxID=483423 RepID=A0A0H5DRZ8_9BACT|nr:trehalose-6-phosphate synthase [Estrella lausannensis]CRX39427.1 hypothetical protein ELAC_2106 [Estrella lausannensis]